MGKKFIHGIVIRLFKLVQHWLTETIYVDIYFENQTKMPLGLSAINCHTRKTVNHYLIISESGWSPFIFCQALCFFHIVQILCKLLILVVKSGIQDCFTAWNYYIYQVTIKSIDYCFRFIFRRILSCLLHKFLPNFKFSSRSTWKVEGQVQSA